MKRITRYAITLAAATGLTVVSVSGQTMGSTLVNAPIQLAQVSQAPDQASSDDSIQSQAEAQRQLLLEQLKAAQEQLTQPPQTLDPSAHISPELNDALLKQVTEAQRQMAEARARIGGSSQAQTLDLADQLLRVVRTRLLNDPNAEAVPLPTSEQISAMVDQAQRQLDEARQVVAKRPDAEALLRQLDRRQQQLDLARSQFASPGRGSPLISDEQTSQIYDNARRTLEGARVKAATMPNAKELLERLDAAEKRLDEAEASHRAQATPPTN